MFKKIYFSTLLALLAARASAQWLDVTPGELPPYNVSADLVRDHLTGPGVEILDVQFDGAPGAVGYFTGGQQSIALQRGLILSTGRAATQGSSFGANETGFDFASTDNPDDVPDALLAAQTTGPLFDLVRYRITFRASGDSIRFRYVFASEEYPEYACSPFNDVFGFFLEGPGYPEPVNIARVPGAGLPVTINNVHPDNPVYAGCDALNDQFYHDNNQSNEQPAYDGYLDVFTAEASVVPCGVYVMTLAIADVGDGVFDSAVFLEANSFGGAPEISASFGPGEAILPENAAANTIALTFDNLPADLLPLTVTLGGSAQNGTDYALLDSVATVASADTVLYWAVQPVADSLAEGFETVTLTVRDTACFYKAFTLFIADPPPGFLSVDTVVMLSGSTATLTASPLTGLAGQSWSFDNTTPIDINPTMALVFSDIDVPAATDGEKPADLLAENLIPFSRLTDLALLESVCVNIQHGWDGDLGLYLFAPNGQFVELSTKNGGNGNHYTNTCFSPSATESITFGQPFAPASAAPFTGIFQPEGDWNDLLDAPLDGVWRLGVIDYQNGFIGQVLDWSLTFSGARLGNFQYLWSTGETTQAVSVTTPGTYTVTVSNAVAAVTQTFVVQPGCGSFSQTEATVCDGETVFFAGEEVGLAGTYSQILADVNGCDSVTTLVLNVLPNVAETLEVVLDPGQTYEAGGQIFSDAGTYTLQLAAANGCDSMLTLVVSFSATAAHEPQNGMALHFSPNPAAGETLLRWDATAAFSFLRVFDARGRLVWSQSMGVGNALTLKTTGWASGWYIVELAGRDGARARGRLLCKAGL